MSPINPNFKPGVGHLVTDRFDFQKHIDGEAFRHQAGSIDLVPSIMIGSTNITDVQTAIAALAGSIIVPSVPDATTVSKGVIQLGGDLFGTGTTALSPKVSGLQGFPVSASAPATNNVLQWNGTTWTPAVIVNATSAVFGTIRLQGDLNGGTASSPVVTGLQTRPVSAVAPTSGQALVWNGSSWLPTGIPSSPTGTGFPHLTSGTYDAAATANIRYSNVGKFQTDVNIQYRNVSITGDLAWTPTGSNKTLTLPDATDTLVGLATVDTLLNKTINASNNNITDTGVALGDILAVVSGSKFTRLVKGANGTFLGVSGGVLGYFTPPGGAITPSGTGFATVTGGVFDAAATANIRYTGGKFQSDVSVQFKNGSITGDLAWAPSGSNKTLTLPNLNDSLVSATSTDVLTNKTINATNNTITDTSTAVGDILKSNGTSFVRFARGTALQVLRTNSGGSDLEWATVDFPAPEVVISQSGAGQLNNVATTDGSSNPAAVIRFTGDGAATDILLSGLAAPPSPTSPTTIRKITLMATSTSRLILSNEDTNSTSTSRFHFFGAASSQYIVGADGYSVNVVWDTTSQRWRPVIDFRAIQLA
jgi:hypothetical protein